MAGIGKEEGIAEKALDSVNELLETKYGRETYGRYGYDVMQIRRNTHERRYKFKYNQHRAI